MLAITQFEVYVLQKGRWTLHARYPSEDRKEAILDARTTEASTGFPAKVIRETYFPDVNDSERITAYISPKAKEQEKALKFTANGRRPFVAARTAASALGRKVSPSRRMRQPLSVAHTFFRVIVAAGISLAAAALIVGVIAWTMGRFVESGMEIAANTRSTVLTYSYVVTFLFIFWSLFRSRLPLHRLLADLWQKASQKPATDMPLTADAKPPKVKPKHDRPPSPEVLREYEDMKVKRGDLDTLPPPVLEEETAPTSVAAPPAEVIPLQPDLLKKEDGAITYLPHSKFETFCKFFRKLIGKDAAKSVARIESDSVQWQHIVARCCVKVFFYFVVIK